MKRNLRSAFAGSLEGSVATICLLTAGLVGEAMLATPASARDFFGFGYMPPSRSYFYSARPSGRTYDYDSGSPKVDRLKAQTAEKLKKTPVPPPTKGPLMVVVSIAKQQLTVYDEGVPLLHSKVSTGSRGHETPTGVFAVIQKARWHRSNLYSDAPMPFMQRITWSGVAMHAGLLPGYPASHGCIRLPEDFAIRMWRTTQMGARVIVAQNDVYPAEISHPVLFLKKSAPAIVPPAPIASLVGLRSTVDAARADLTKADPMPVSAAPEGAPKADASQVKVAEVAIVRAGQPAGGAPVASDRPADAASSPVTSAATASISAEKPISREAPVMAAPQASQPSMLAQAPVAPALTPSEPSPPVMNAPVQAPAPSLTPDRALRAGPVSVFVSRKERKLFVRKGFAPVFETAIVIKDADKPLGTHVFTALAQEKDSDAFRWNVVSVPNSRADRRAEQPVHVAARKKRADEPVTDAAPVPPPVASTEAAKEALDRIDMPADAVQRISELMTAGASLIITDEGLGPETGQETDFVVLTKDGPQAPAAKKVKRHRYEDDY